MDIFFTNILFHTSYADEKTASSFVASDEPSMAAAAQDPPLLDTVLQSQDFVAVDQPLFSALELFRRTHDVPGNNIPSYVWEVMQRVQTSANLNAKRFVWLVCMRCCPAIANYVVSNNPNQDRASRFMVHLDADLERLFRGGYSSFEMPIDEFVSAALLAYNAS